MRKVKIKKVGLDWVGRCKEHYEAWTTGTWHDAYELATGHVCMFHPKPKVKDLYTGRPMIYRGDARMEERL